MTQKNIKIKKAKVPSSNYSIADQKRSIERTLTLLKPSKRKFSFLGKPYMAFVTDEFSVLRPLPEEEKIFKKLLAPRIMLNCAFLREVYKKLEAFPLNRFFFITVREDNTVTINDRLNRDKTTLTGCVAGGNASITFKIDSRMFFFFKLNMKTITSRCYLYVSKNAIIYENGRGKKGDTELYLMSRKQKTMETKNEKTNYNDFSFINAGI